MDHADALFSSIYATPLHVTCAIKPAAGNIMNIETRPDVYV